MNESYIIFVHGRAYYGFKSTGYDALQWLLSAVEDWPVLEAWMKADQRGSESSLLLAMRLSTTQLCPNREMNSVFLAPYYSSSCTSINRVVM